MMHLSAIPCLFAQSVRECHCYLSLSFSTSKSFSGTSFVVCFFLNVLFLLFCDNLTCKYVSRMHLVAVQPLNRPDTACWLVQKKPKALVVSFFQSCNLQKHKPNLSSCFKTSKYFSRTLLYEFQPLKTSNVHCFLNFKLQEHDSYLFVAF